MILFVRIVLDLLAAFTEAFVVGLVSIEYMIYLYWQIILYFRAQDTQSFCKS